MLRVIRKLLWQGVRDLSLNVWSQLATLGGVTMAVFLSGLFLMTLTTLDEQLGMVRGETAFQVYWHPGVGMDQIQEQWEKYPHLPGFQDARTYTPEEALRELGARIGRTGGSLEGEFLFLAEKCPLPATALLTFAPEDQDIERWMADTTGFLKSQPGVSRVVTTPLRDELGRAWRTVSRFVIWPSVAFLGLVLGLVVANTVRLSLLSRAQEIEILQMVGAFPWYVRLPLVTTGALLGLGGGAIALALLKVVHAQIRHVLNFPPLLMEIRFPDWPLAASLVLVPAFMGAVASWLAVRRQ